MTMTHPPVHPVVSHALTVLNRVQQARRRWGDGTTMTVLRGMDALGYAHLVGEDVVLLGRLQVRVITARAMSYTPGCMEDVKVHTFLPRGVLPVARPRRPLRSRAETSVSPTTFARGTLTSDEVQAAMRLAWEVNVLRSHRIAQE